MQSQFRRHTTLPFTSTVIHFSDMQISEVTLASIAEKQSVH